MMNQVLGVRIDCLEKHQALAQVSAWLAGNEQTCIFTPNPEMLVDAYNDPYFKTVLNHANLNLCDGFGLRLVLALMGKRAVRIPGVEFMIDLCRLAEQEHKTIYLLGSGNDHVIQQTKHRLKYLFPDLQIVGYDPGIDLELVPRFGQSGAFSHTETRLKYDSHQHRQIIEHITIAAPDILFVAYGHNKQEKWIYEHLGKVPSVKVAMGVGGSFDYISGTVRRAPTTIRTVGLEWLYRLICQPWRFPRIWKATFVFLFLVIRKRNK